MLKLNPHPNPHHGTMESNVDDATPCTTTTNWTISGGSLSTTVTFESSIAPIDDEPNHASRSPLILSPPSSDSSPCEITLSFTQKHEIRQVYVRSTARVYELYYAPQQCSTNEYLCTVRCGIAAKDEDMVHSTDPEGIGSSEQKGYSDNLADESLKSESNLSTTEDGWIDVKALETPQLDNKKVPLPSKTDVNPERSTQDFYEATAEMSDTDPCTSLTLRLLSLQSMGGVYIDELYVFADPVDPADSENQAGPVENSAGSSLMAMFMPTLMQLSKTRSVGGITDQHTVNTRDILKVPEVGLEATDSTINPTKMQQNGKFVKADLSNIATNIQQDGTPWVLDQQEVKSQVGSAPAVGPAQLHCSPQVPDPHNQPDFPLNSRIEIALDQLVSRVGKIEELCLKFEENMLKPISGIEKRLQRVEEQLEVLTKRTENSRSCTRFSAPEFSCYESDSNFNNSGSYLNCGTFESREKDIPSEISAGPDDMSSSVNDVQLLTGLVVTAPEFCNGDDEEEIEIHASEPVTYTEIRNVDYEEENHASESVTDSPKDKPKHTLSIDDALASALIGFLSSTSGQPGKYNQSLAVKAPDFSSEDESDGSAGKKPSRVSEIPRDSSGCYCESDCIEGLAVSPICYDEIEGTSCAKDSRSCSSNISEREADVTVSPNIDCSEELADGVDIQCQDNEDGVGNSRHAHIEKRIEQDTGMTELPCMNTNNAIASNAVSNNLVPVDTDVSNQMPQNLDNHCSGIDHEDVCAVDCNNLTEGSNSEVLQSVIEFSHAPCMVNFETPILDVKFISQEKFGAKSSLEALLADMPESNSQANFVEVEDGSPTGEQSSLIMVEDGEVSDHAPDNHFFVDMNYFKPDDDAPDIMEDERRLENYTSSSGEVSLI